MTENKQLLDKQSENADVTTGQTYVRSAGTSIGVELPKNENGPTITGQSDTRSAGRGISPGLARALTGGLIGATLGILAGALANNRTAKGVNHAAKGVGDGAKNVAEGVNHAAKGVGDAVKSVADGVNYVVVGGLAESLNQVVTGAVEAAKDTAEDVKSSVVGAVDTVKGAAEDVKPSDNPSFKLDEDRLVAGNKQTTTGEFGIGEQAETETADISAPVEEEILVVVQTIPVDTGISVAFGEADFLEGGVARTQADEDTIDTTTAYPLQ